MRLAFRLTLFLIVGVAAVATGFAYYQVQTERRSLERDLRRQAFDLVEMQAKAVQPLMARRAYRELQTLVDRSSNRERLVGMAVYDAAGMPVAISSALVAKIHGMPPAILPSLDNEQASTEFVPLGGTLMHVAAMPIQAGSTSLGTVVVFHDAGYIDVRTSATWRRTMASVGLQTMLILSVTIITLRWALGRSVLRMAQWLRELRIGVDADAPQLPEEPAFEPLTREVSRLASSFTAARAAAEEEARLRDTADSHWTTDRLRVFVQGRLNGSRLVAVSNREPYEHFRRPAGMGDNIECSVPASGLVTALEPILRACDGTWIAHGSGDADREMVDVNDRLPVPPDEPKYTLRRVWLTKEEEEGYYYGFSNEGLWPLCHIAHTRPLFRTGDWEYYRSVNKKFAAALLEEMADTHDPVLLIQDYHFALLPQ